MSRILIALAATALFPLAAVGSENMVHPEHASVSTYKPIQGFSHTIGERHFVGYFVMAQDRCAVTVIDATVARDRDLEGPRRQKFELPAGGRAEIKADHGKALGIGCSAGATEITVVALEPNIPASASNPWPGFELRRPWRGSSSIGAFPGALPCENLRSVNFIGFVSQK